MDFTIERKDLFVMSTTVCMARLFCICAALSVLVSTAHAQSRPPLVQSVDIEIPWAPEPVRIAGREQLVYELHVTNFRPYDVALTRLEVRDVERDTVIADFRGPALASMIGRPGVPPGTADHEIIHAGMRSVIYLWIPILSGRPVPERLAHKLEMGLVRSTGVEPVSVQGSVVEVRKARPLVLGPPLSGGPWAALYDPSMNGGHRKAIYTLDGHARIPARFAVDWIRLESDGTKARGDDSLIANFHGYGAEVLAVANATVFAAMDDIPEAPTRGGEPPPLENASGNFITLDLGKGRYAFYEHLKHGSLRVKAGDRVKRGQVIAQLGNSGSSSSGPHLHFHVADTSAHLAAEGVPYVFRSFEVIGAFPSIDVVGTGAAWQAVLPEAGGRRTEELPAANTVILFPDQR